MSNSNCNLLEGGNMAEYVYGSVPYGQYLQENAYVRDITGQIKKSGEATSVKSTSKCLIIRCIDSVFGYIIGLT